MRVAHIIWTAHFGGIEKLVYDLARAQSQDPEIRPAVIFGRAEGGFLDKFHASGVPCFDLGFRSGFDLHPGRVLNAWRLFQKFDLLHLHTFVPGLALAAAASRRPIVYTEHGNFSAGRKLTWRDSLKRPLHSWFLARSISHLTFNSEHTQREWRRRYKKHRHDTTVVMNGVDLEVLLRPGSDVTGGISGLEQTVAGAFVVGLVARFASVKRIDRLIRAFAAFQTNRRALLLLVGDGPLRSDLEQLVAQLGIGSKTIFTGFQPHVQDYLRMMHVCVLPSVGESFGLSVVENLALGKPTIVFADGGGAADIVRPLCAEDVVADECSLAGRLSFYHNYPDLLRSKEADRAAYARKFHISRTASEFQVVYDRFTKKR